jgi:quercetin dioxygenase-like cupin family protein
MAADDVVVVLEGRMSIASNGRTVTAGPGEIVYMPRGEKVRIRAHEAGAVTAYVTYLIGRELENKPNDSSAQPRSTYVTAGSRK